MLLVNIKYFFPYVKSCTTNLSSILMSYNAEMLKSDLHPILKLQSELGTCLGYREDGIINRALCFYGTNKTGWHTSQKYATSDLRAQILLPGTKFGRGTWKLRCKILLENCNTLWHIAISNMSTLMTLFNIFPFNTASNFLFIITN